MYQVPRGGGELVILNSFLGSCSGTVPVTPSAPLIKDERSPCTCCTILHCCITRQVLRSSFARAFGPLSQHGCHLQRGGLLWVRCGPVDSLWEIYGTNGCAMGVLEHGPTIWTVPASAPASASGASSPCKSVKNPCNTSTLLLEPLFPASSPN